MNDSTTPASSSRRTRAIAVALAGASAVVIWALARLIFDADFLVPAQGDVNNRQEITAVFSFVVALLSSLVGWGVLALLERKVDKAKTIWTVVAVVFTVLSLAPPMTLEDTPIETRLALTLMHVAVALIVIPAFRKTSTRN